MTREAPPRLPDADARRRATTDFETNLVVLAGAGTGKTSLLVERLLVALGSSVITIDRMAAITFTEKAAGEMRERLAEGLEHVRALAGGEIESSDPGSAADRAFSWLAGEQRIAREQIASRALAAMEGLDQATVITLHGFCSELLHRYPVEASVDPGFTVDSGEHEASLWLSSWEAFVAHELGPDAPRAELWSRLLDRLPLRNVAATARGLAGFGVPGDMLDPRASRPSARELFGAAAAALAREIATALERQSGMNANASQVLGAAAPAFEQVAAGGLDAFRSRMEADDVLESWATASSKAAPSPGTRLEGLTKEACADLLRRTLDLMRGLARIDEELVDLLLEALQPFAIEFRETYLRAGFVSFDGLLALTRDLLRDHPEVRKQLKRRYGMLLVDEFQDTDPLQYEIVLFLAERADENATDPYEANPDPGRLFIVGDAKQSIYRFRGADFAAYRRAVGRIEEAGGRVLDLVSNFRSVEQILDPVNELFGASDGSWHASAFQPEYVPIRAVRSPGPAEHPALELWTVEVPEPRLADDRREAEGRALAEEIERLVGEGLYRYRDLTMVFRAYTRISHYLRPLRERGIPFVVDGGREFLNRPEVAHLLATLRTISQPADPAALLAFLRSPAGSVPDTSLAEFADAGGRFSWQTAVDRKRFPLIASRYDLLRELAADAQRLPIDVWARRVVERTALLPLAAAAFEGAQRVANLRKLAAAACELARDGILSVEEVIEALREGRLAGIDADSPLSDEETDAVRISSIHRMKGLENRVILFPDLARERGEGFTRNEDVRVARTDDGRAAVAIRTPAGRSALDCWLEREDRNHEKAEETRVFYVALTRACERLVMVAGPTRRKSEWLRALGPWDYDVDEPPEDGARLAGGRVLHRFMTAGRARRGVERPVPSEIDAAGARYDEALARLTDSARSAFRSPSDEEPGGEDRRLPPSAAIARELSMKIGSLVHHLLEHWDGKDPSEPLGWVTGASERLSRESGVDAAALEAGAREVLEPFLHSELARRIGRVRILGREVPLLLRAKDGRVFRGSVDLLYRDEQGDLIVADYKTDRETDEAALADRYREQVGVYTRAVQEAFGLLFPPRAELWLLRSGERIGLG